ncbi:hypothetical protein J7L87_02000 [bacterium]|nr:hypothetical protein [bacterium]
MEEKGIELREDIIIKDFQWQYKGVPYSLRLSIRREMYENYTKKQRVPAEKWAEEYVAKGICPEIRELAYQLIKMGKPYNTYEEVDFVLSFVQSVISYAYDEEDGREVIKGEYPKYPLETLVEQKGDCEDFSILGAALLKSMGYDVGLILLLRHCALGISGVKGISGDFIEYQGKRYYYCEMAGEGWKIGKLPPGDSLEEAELLPVPGIPVTVNVPEVEKTEGGKNDRI